MAMAAPALAAELGSWRRGPGELAFATAMAKGTHEPELFAGGGHAKPSRIRGPMFTAAIALPQQEQQQQAGGRVAAERGTIRLGLPSKGRMSEGTLSLLSECSIPVRKLNPRQYIADIPGLDDLEVWFQRESDVVRKLRTGDMDMGILGYDVLAEFGEDDENLVIVHDNLGFGKCHLSIAVPTYGIFDSVSTLQELAAMPQWTAQRPLRICTGFSHVGAKFLRENGLEHVMLSRADGALEAAPAMGSADAILDLVSSGVTLRENNLKELDGGQVLSSEGVLVANRKALLTRRRVLDTARELLERLEAHLRARGQFTVIANMRGSSEQEVADRILRGTTLAGLQGPTISPVFSSTVGPEPAKVEYYAIVLVVAKSQLYEAVLQLRAIGGSGVLVTPLTYIFDEEPPRWRQLLKALNLCQ